LLLLKVAFKPLMTFTKTFDRAVDFLKSYEKLIIKAENRSFQSPKLIALQEIFKSEDYQASMAIGSLRKILYRLMNRMNLMYAAVNVFFLLDMALLLNAEKWKAKYGSKVKLWFDTIHEIDLLNDMSSMAYGNPDFIFPEIRDGKHQLNTIDLGHPLIHASGRIKNNFELNGEGSLGLITGSNMSGKSTFLRTVGVNLVMAQAGLPVCASTLTMSPTRVFTSMRTQDNLEEHISSFYAELSRIKLLLDSIGEVPIFFLLDEILKGTNSEDRHKGSLALIDQLSEKNGTGLISTHDLTLSNLKNEKARNYSFNSEIIKDEIIFDYKLTDGPCRSFNASKLMEQMGIIVSK
ncbi:MAG: DNA mismatch repair ATPase MutS, partial [Bacteroidia bacterium]